jgi:hypothetical protein
MTLRKLLLGIAIALSMISPALAMTSEAEFMQRQHQTIVINPPPADKYSALAASYSVGEAINLIVLAEGTGRRYTAGMHKPVQRSPPCPRFEQGFVS